MKVKENKVSARYAKAIYEFVDDKSGVKKIVGELKEFSEIIENHDELKMVCISAIFSKEQRSAVLEDIISKTGVSDVTRKIILILSDGKRLIFSNAIAYSLEKMILESNGVASLEVESADSLDSTEQEAIKNKFKKFLGKDVAVNFDKSDELIAGVRVTADGKTYDGTLATRLDILKEQLVRG